MACDTQTMTLRRPVWCTSTTAIFIPFTRLAENEVASARVSYMLERGDGTLQVVPATRGTKDGYTYPDAPVVWGGQSYTSTNQWEWGTGYVGPDDDYQFLEFGFLVKNSSGSDPRCAVATLVIDVRK